MPQTHAEGDLGELVDADSNREVLAYLGAQSLHCHGDLGQLLVDTARNLCGETLAYSPSFATFKYVALVTKRRIFALGENMTSACFRVPPGALRGCRRAGRGDGA